MRPPGHSRAAGPAVDQDRDRAVVDQRHVHVRAEPARRDRDAGGGQLLDQVVEQRQAGLRVGGALDTTFSNDGTIALYDADRAGGFGELLVRDDGGVVTLINVSAPVASTPGHIGTPTDDTSVLARYRADGTPDPSLAKTAW
jgi:hypothetical protein